MAEYVTITDPADDRLRLGSGDTLANALIDLTQTGPEAVISAQGQDWTIRDVGFKGALTVDSQTAPARIVVAGTGSIEGVYLGDGVDISGASSQSGVTTYGYHEGAVTITRSYFGGWSDAAVDAAEPADNNDGTVAISRSYFRDNRQHAAIAADGSSIRGSVIHNTNRVPAGEDGATASDGVTDAGFGIEGLADVVTVRDCDIAVTSDNTGGTAAAIRAEYASFNVENSRIQGAIVDPDDLISETGIEGNPSTAIPNGVPETAEAAAAGFDPNTPAPPQPGDGDDGDGGETPPDDGSDGGDGGDGGGVTDPPEEEPPDNVEGEDPTAPPDAPPPRNQYEVDDKVPTYGQGSGPSTFQAVIGDQPIETVTNMTIKGEGRNSQYLTEMVKTASGDVPLAEYEAQQNAGGETGETPTDDAGTDGSGSGSGDADKTPPLTVTLECRLGSDAYAELESLRRETEPFTATIGGVTLDDLELVDIRREISGDQPNSYAATLVMREYREVELRLPIYGSAAGGGGSPTSPGTGGNPTTGAPALPGSGGVREPQGQFDTEVIPAGERRRVSVGSGETLSNILYDIRASGAGIGITADGNNWAIKNIGIRGVMPTNLDFTIRTNVSSSGATGLVDNIYMGDGEVPHAEGGGLFMFGNRGHRGHVTIRRMNMQQFVNNGIYGSQPASEHNQSGTFDVENSYFHSNNIANIRTGTLPPNECVVRNCVVMVNESAVPPCGVGCSSWGAVNPRGLWSWCAPTRVINSDIGASASGMKGGSFIWENTRRGAQAQNRYPKGVPLTAEAAAGGTY